MNGDKNNKNWSRLYEQSKLLVECFPPLLVFPDTIEALELIKSKGIYMGVISNTTFISGESLIEVLKHYSILQYFSYCYFSDQHRYCKPDANAFSVARLNILYKEPLLLEGNYLHIGNDPVTDNTSEAGKRWNHLLINEDSSNSLVELIKDIT
jgi:FMN phosphatase YigB (HAD superfamily)